MRATGVNGQRRISAVGFNKLKGAYRESFLSAVAGFGWFYFSIVINKRKLTGPGFQFKQSFYEHTCGLVFENAKPHLDQATVVIDGSGSRYIHKVKVQDSQQNNLLQLADLVCGAVARSYSEKPDALRFRRFIAHREIYVQFWPK